MVLVGGPWAGLIRVRRHALLLLWTRIRCEKGPERLDSSCPRTAGGEPDAEGLFVDIAQSAVSCSRGQTLQ